MSTHCDQLSVKLRTYFFILNAILKYLVSGANNFTSIFNYTHKHNYFAKSNKIENSTATELLNVLYYQWLVGTNLQLLNLWYPKFVDPNLYPQV